ncbi:MAG: ACT domain-containing protein [Gammaproteobacteria bacterium]|nr:MAG: ACT domain-containing protein [Gammaproteobacteria bacterium]
MKWSVLTLVGADQQGIVASISRVLFDAGCQLAEASMMRLGGNFAIMLRVQHEEAVDLQKVLADVVTQMQLHLHLDEDVEAQPAHIEPDVHITVYGADRTGIVAEVTGRLAEAGLNIIDLETAVGGSPDKPIYIMSIEGSATRGIDTLQQAVEALASDIEVSLVPVDTLRG